MKNKNDLLDIIGLNRVKTTLLLALVISMLIFLAVFGVSKQSSFAQSQNGQTYSIPTSYATITQKQYDSSEICNQRIPVVRLMSSASEQGNLPGNTIDGNLNTHWSSHAVNKYIQVDLGSLKTICGVSIAWFKGDTRQNFFTISTSKDKVNYSNILQGISSGHTRLLENYQIQSSSARYLKISVSHNTQNTWASISEITIFGSNQSTNPPPISVNHPPIVSNVTGISTLQDKAVTIPIIVSDPDQGDNAVITNKSSPAHGKLSLGSTQNSFVYTPTLGYFGQDSFNIQATDNHGALSNIATVSITITPSAPAGGGNSSSGQGFDKFGIKEVILTANCVEEDLIFIAFLYQYE